MARRRSEHSALVLTIAMIALASGALWLVGCSLLPESTPTPTSVAPTETPLPSPTASPTLSPVNTPVDPTAPLTLTLWLPPEMVLEDEPAAKVIDEMNESFMAANRLVNIEVIPKAAHGPGGLVDMLLATEPVVPGRMPDLVLFDLSELHSLADKDILAPLEDLFPKALWDDLFPFTLQAVTVDEDRLAMPLGADIFFLAYNSAMVESPPRTWDELLTGKATYLFPANQGDGSAADAFLLLYFAQGGSLEGAERLELNTTLAASLLRKYRAAAENGTVPDMVRTMSTLDDCWAVYLAGEASMSLV